MRTLFKVNDLLQSLVITTEEGEVKMRDICYQVQVPYYHLLPSSGIPALLLSLDTSSVITKPISFFSEGVVLTNTASHPLMSLSGYWSQHLSSLL